MKALALISGLLAGECPQPVILYWDEADSRVGHVGSAPKPQQSRVLAPAAMPSVG